jgi:anti-anti-sigma factor
MLRVHTRKFGYATVLCLNGQIVISELNTLRSAVQDQSEAGTIVLDFAHVTRIDARGLGVLLELREELLAKGIEFKVVNVSRLVSQVFQISRLASVFGITPDANVMAAVMGVGLSRFGYIVTCAQEA